jgi:hypothetical protein
MKFHKTILFLYLAAAVSCSDFGESSVPINIEEKNLLLYKVLNGPLNTPIDKLKSEFVYSGPSTLRYRTDYYYDFQERELLRVTIQDGDTLAIYLNEYLENGKLDQTSVFSSDSKDFVFVHFFKNTYQNNEQTITIMKGGDGNLSQHEQYTFDELGRKISYRRGNETQFSLHRYIYETNQSNKIYEELYLESAQTEPLYRYHYTYNGSGLLQAKIISFTDNADTIGEQAEFEYFYNERGNLSEERKNDIRFFSGIRERRTYEYY